MSESLQEKVRRLKVDLVREDGRLERLCKHGVGHTVGHVNHAEIYDKYAFMHGCDGCCSGWEIEPE
jgi:hypothetical protein